jgi:putative DNA methylase
MTETIHKKKLIEVSIPLEAINKASAREKSIRHGHPSTLHLWWARRPLATCRAVLFAQLVDDPSAHLDIFPTEGDQQKERDRLFKIIEELVLWENSTNEDVLARARAEIVKSCGANLPSIYDPFSGGCSIPLEAQRLGLPSYGSDLNPVAVVIGKSMVEIPTKFTGAKPVHPGGKERLNYVYTEGLAEDINYYGQKVQEQALDYIGDLYPQVDLPAEYGNGKANVIAWIWARTVPSPDPALNGLHVPLIRCFDLSTKDGKRAWVEPIIGNGNYKFEVRSEDRGDLGSGQKGTINKQGGHCIVSKAALTFAYIRKQAKQGNMGQKLMAIVADGPKKRVYLPPSSVHESTALSQSKPDLIDMKLPEKALGFRVQAYGMESFADLFTNRQLVALSTFGKLVEKIRTQIEQDALAMGLSGDSMSLRDGGTGAKAYAEAVSIYLAFAVDRSSNTMCTIARWTPDRQQTVTAFARQAIPMTWDFPEVNPFSGAAGDYLVSAKGVAKGVFGLGMQPEGIITQSDAQSVDYPDNCVISCDPPYYDNIGYADLSDFFFFWMKPVLKEVYPALFGVLATPKSEELIASPFRHGGKDAAEMHFLEGMSRALKNMADQTSSEIPATIYYAFKQSEIKEEGISSTGWATFLQAVIEAGYAVVGTWPMRTELANRMVASGTNALANSVVLVCRKREIKAAAVTRAEFIRALKQEIPPAIHELQKANITPVDMPQASIGPGIGIYSRYKTVLESDDSPMTVKTALQLINKELDEFLSEQEGEFDSDTRFAVTWFEQNGFSPGAFGDADNLARARGLSVDSVKHAGIIESVAGKVRLLSRDELDADWSPDEDTHLTVWECTQYLTRALQEGESAAAVLLKKMGADMADSAHDLAYRLFDICDKNNQAKEASAYNSLIAVWPDLTVQAAQISGFDTKQEQLDML